MILSCDHIYKAFGVTEILRDVSFHIEDNEKTALIGLNGSGKTTLLKIITGKETADNGTVVISKGCDIGYLEQNHDLEDDTTVYDYIAAAKSDVFALELTLRNLEHSMKEASGEELEKLYNSYSEANHKYELLNGYAAKSEIIGVLKGLGFNESDFSSPVSSLSGGIKTRAALGRLLVSKPSLLLLDEPTNHLDLASITWLENFLVSYPGAVLVVSHDRYFLDKVVTHVVEIENHTAMDFKGNYSAYNEKKAVIRKSELNAYLKQQADIKHQQEVITKLKSFNREKSIKRAESREKMLSHIEILDKPADERPDMKLSFDFALESGNDVLTVESLAKSYGDKHLFENINFEIKKGEHTALIGANGCGKTTILKIINGYVSPDRGTITIGTNVAIGYFDQELQVLDPEKSIFEEISDTYPDMTETRIRNVCAAFLFRGDEVFAKIKTLSGGERSRVSLCKLMLSGANLLILDEPTNHLDMASREVLEDALNQYPGTLLYVSHDRYFINRTAHRVIELESGNITSTLGDYDYYFEKKAQRTASAAASVQASVTAAPTENAEKWRSSKQEAARIRKIKNDIEKTEAAISKLEDEKSEKEKEMYLPENASNSYVLNELCNEIAAIDEELLTLYEKWE